jgi:hypothetical protein
VKAGTPVEMAAVTEAGMAASRTDAERIDYLNANTQRLGEVYWRIENEGGTVRDAIDWFIDVRDVREREDKK